MNSDGLTAVDLTGVLTGNADLVCERETPRPDPVKHLPGHEHSDAIAMPWLTERRADLIFVGLAVVGIYMGMVS